MVLELGDARAWTITISEHYNGMYKVRNFTTHCLMDHLGIE